MGVPVYHAWDDVMIRSIDDLCSVASVVGNIASGYNSSTVDSHIHIVNLISQDIYQRVTFNDKISLPPGQTSIHQVNIDKDTTARMPIRALNRSNDERKPSTWIDKKPSIVSLPHTRPRRQTAHGVLGCK